MSSRATDPVRRPKQHVPVGELVQLLRARTPDPELVAELRALCSDVGADGRDRADRLPGA